MEVDSIKPKLKAPGTKRLKRTSREPHSNFAFKFNLRRYTQELLSRGIDMTTDLIPVVGRCGLTPWTSC